MSHAHSKSTPRGKRSCEVVMCDKNMLNKNMKSDETWVFGGWRTNFTATLSKSIKVLWCFQNLHTVSWEANSGSCRDAFWTSERNISSVTYTTSSFIPKWGNIKEECMSVQQMWFRLIFLFLFYLSPVSELGFYHIWSNSQPFSQVWTFESHLDKENFTF